MNLQTSADLPAPVALHPTLPHLAVVDCDGVAGGQSDSITITRWACQHGGRTVDSIQHRTSIHPKAL